MVDAEVEAYMKNNENILKINGYERVGTDTENLLSNTIITILAGRNA
jgi:hypothetical protein